MSLRFIIIFSFFGFIFAELHARNWEFHRFEEPAKPLIITKNETLLKEKGNGEVTYSIYGRQVKTTDAENRYYIKAKLEFESMITGKIYDQFEYVDPMIEHQLLEVIGNAEKRLEFIMPFGQILFSYKSSAPAFRATFTDVKVKDVCACPWPQIADLSGWKSGTSPTVYSLDLKYPKICGENLGAGFVCSWKIVARSRTINFSSKGTLADGDQLYIRDLNGEKKIVKMLANEFTNITLESRGDDRLKLFFFGSPNPNRDRKIEILHEF